ncbi:MAG TPA: GNAT family N-acetyltransferase [Burkholderiaceae bacterium]|nr:GNAT family N-acetyltransferase [Burkholderiaceae bacterium]
MNIPPTTATLKSGVVVTLRPLRPDDRERMAKAVRGLDPQTIYTRLFSHRKDLTEAGLDRIMHVDDEHEVVIVASVGSGPEEAIIGGARYIATGEGRAEIAFTVEEDYQGQGVAGRLFDALVDAGRRRGITVFEADVLAENPSMLRVFARTGLPMRKRSEGGVVHMELSLARE